MALFLRGGLVPFGHALFYAVGASTASFAEKTNTIERGAIVHQAKSEP